MPASRCARAASASTGTARRRARHGRLRPRRHPAGYATRARQARHRLSVHAKRSGENRLGPALKAAFGGVYIANEKMTGAERRTGAGRRRSGCRGLRPALHRQPRPAAPPASERGVECAAPETYYHPGAEGYVDYPAPPETIPPAFRVRTAGPHSRSDGRPASHRRGVRPAGRRTRPATPAGVAPAANGRFRRRAAGWHRPPSG